MSPGWQGLGARRSAARHRRRRFACCAVNAASYLAPLLVLLLHKPAPATAAAGRTAPAKGRTSAGLLDGARYARRHGPILVCLFLAAAAGLLFNMGVSPPVLATRVFHLGGGGYGLLMAAFGVGALPGALLASATRAKPDWSPGRRAGAGDGGRDPGHRARADGLAGVRRARRHRLPVDLVHRRRQHARPASRRAGDARPDDGAVDHGAARHPAGERPAQRPGDAGGDRARARGSAQAGMALTVVAVVGWRALTRGPAPSVAASAVAASSAAASSAAASSAAASSSSAAAAESGAA